MNSGMLSFPEITGTQGLSGLENRIEILVLSVFGPQISP